MARRSDRRMELTLPSNREVVVTRVLDFPRERVFQAYTDREAIPEWWGPRDLETTVEAMDLQPGGRWRFVQRAPDGAVHAFHGVYREIVPHERISRTFEYEGAPGHVLEETTTFQPLGKSRTKVTVTARYATVEDRDAMLKAGMEFGMKESFERLEELLGP